MNSINYFCPMTKLPVAQGDIATAIYQGHTVAFCSSMRRDEYLHDVTVQTQCNPYFDSILKGMPEPLMGTAQPANDYKSKIDALRAEWDRLDGHGSQSDRQNAISREIETLQIRLKYHHGIDKY